MKTQFTATQQEILEQLQNEFSKMNESKQTTSKKGLVDWGRINDNVDAWADKKYEVEKHNEAMYALKYEAEQTIEQQLQDEFCMFKVEHGTANWNEELGCSKRRDFSTTWYIRRHNQFNEYIFSIGLEFNRKRIWSECGNFVEEKVVGFYFSGYIKINSVRSASYKVDTFEQIFELPIFIDAMTKEMSR
jgi:hypothetical protein